jgi:hypothetical protein
MQQRTAFFSLEFFGHITATGYYVPSALSMIGEQRNTVQLIPEPHKRCEANETKMLSENDNVGLDLTSGSESVAHIQRNGYVNKMSTQHQRTAEPQ